jgi:hypothetical protein
MREASESRQGKAGPDSRRYGVIAVWHLVYAFKSRSDTSHSIHCSNQSEPITPLASMSAIDGYLERE